MKLPRIRRMLAALACAAALAAASKHDRAPADEIAAVERDFASAFQEKSWASFVERAAEDAIFPAPPEGFVSGRAVFEELAKDAGNSRKPSLDWWPSHVEAACANDLAWSTGPTVRKDSRGTFYSHYVTLWVRQANGEWRWTYDRGNPHVGPGTYPRGALPETVSRDYCRKLGNDRADEARASLAIADRQLLDAVRKNPVAAYRGRLSKNVRLHRFGLQPAVGRKRALAVLADEPPLLTYEPVGIRVSSSGDLGYTYGNMSWREKERGDQKGAYLHIWRRTGSRWELALDQITPAIPPKQLGPA